MSRQYPSHTTRSSGQALVILLAFMATAMTLTVAATIVTLVNTRTTSTFVLGQDALSLAESGADNAMLRLLREPSYAGETMNMNGGTVTITVSGSTTRTITARASVGGAIRTVEVTAASSDDALTITSWKVVP